MANITLEGVRLQFVVDIGAVTDAKVQSLKDSLGDRYPIISKGQPNPSIVLTNPETKRTILIVPNSVIFMDERTGAADFMDARQEVTRLFKALLLDPKCRVILVAQGRLEAEGGSALGYSREHFLPAEAMESFSEWPELRGVGLRFLIGNGASLQEVKVEPLLRDDRFFYFETVWHSDDPCLVEDACDMAMEALKQLLKLGSQQVLPALGI